MGVICFASLKGGVGKTSISINVAHAFATRDCRTLLIDCDPSSHASRFFNALKLGDHFPSESPLARLFLSTEFESPRVTSSSQGAAINAEHRVAAADSAWSDSEDWIEESDSRVTALRAKTPLIVNCRENLDVIPAGGELRHFLWGRGARAFRTQFPALIEELRNSYDHVVIDTPPDLNVITRNTIAVADLVVVPVDSSEMSIACLEEIVDSHAHIRGPRWAILRSMVNRAAKRVQKLAGAQLAETLGESLENDVMKFATGEAQEYDDEDFDDTTDFLALVESVPEESRHHVMASADQSAVNPANGAANPEESLDPIYLLRSMTYRTEEQNRLTFLQKTAFDTRQTRKLQTEYLKVAKELEDVLTLISGSEPEFGGSVLDNLSQQWA